MGHHGYVLLQLLDEPKLTNPKATGWIAKSKLHHLHPGQTAY